MPSLMLVPLAVSEELKQHTDRIALHSIVYFDQMFLVSNFEYVLRITKISGNIRLLQIFFLAAPLLWRRHVPHSRPMILPNANNFPPKRVIFWVDSIFCQKSWLCGCIQGLCQTSNYPVPLVAHINW